MYDHVMFTSIDINRSCPDSNVFIALTSKMICDDKVKYASGIHVHWSLHNDVAVEANDNVMMMILETEGLGGGPN